jgi:hypothetical protein
MQYSLAKDKVTYVLPGAKGVFVSCFKGCLWLTRAGDQRDHILGPGDKIHLEDGVKTALMALTKTSTILKGRRFQLLELEMGEGRWRINKIKIRQAGHIFRTRLLDRLGPRYSRAIRSIGGEFG